MAGAILCASGVYAIRNTVTGKVYVGQSANVRKRVRRHFAMLRAGTHHSEKLQRAFNKDGEGMFVAEVLELCERAGLDACEQKFIDAFDAYRAGYNACPVPSAPMAGKSMSQESRARIAAALVGRRKTEITRQRLSEALCGRPHPPERVEANRAGQCRPEVRLATSLRMIGNTHSRGTVLSDATKAKLSASWTPERKAAHAERMRNNNPRARKKNGNAREEAIDAPG